MLICDHTLSVICDVKKNSYLNHVFFLYPTLAKINALNLETSLSEGGLSSRDHCFVAFLAGPIDLINCNFRFDSPNGKQIGAAATYCFSRAASFKQAPLDSNPPAPAERRRETAALRLRSRAQRGGTPGPGQAERSRRSPKQGVGPACAQCVRAEAERCSSAPAPAPRHPCPGTHVLAPASWHPHPGTCTPAPTPQHSHPGTRTPAPAPWHLHPSTPAPAPQHRSCALQGVTCQPFWQKKNHYRWQLAAGNKQQNQRNP